MITAMALVVPGSGVAGYHVAYRIISGEYAGSVFHAPREDQRRTAVVGANVLVRFCPDDQFAREVSACADA